EVALRGRAFADIGQGDGLPALEGRGHGPADGVAEPAADIARERIEAVVARRIEDGELAPLEGVLLVGEDLVTQVDERIVPRHQPAQHPIGGEAHVVAVEEEGLGGAERLLARRLQVEARLAVAGGPEEALGEGWGQGHAETGRAWRPL